MNIHKNALFTPRGRCLLVTRALEPGVTRAEIAEEFGTTVKTVSKWVNRYLQEGTPGLNDRSSRPLQEHPKAISTRTIKRMLKLREKRWVIDRIALELGIGAATVSRYLQKHGLNRLSLLEPKEPIRRYERKHPGSLIHMDTKKLGRFNKPGHRVTRKRSGSVSAGWEVVHLCIDDYSRVSYMEVLPDEKKKTVKDFFIRACHYYKTLGIEVEELLTDNGSAYKSKDFNSYLAEQNIKHRFTRYYRPQTNGKAERLVQTMLKEWAYAKSYRSSAVRRSHLNKWLHDYNWHRPHSSLNKQVPISRLNFEGNNLLMLHS